MPTFIKAYEEKDGLFYAKVNGYFDKIAIHGESETCFVCDGYKCTTIGELISLCRYTSESVLGRKIIISIEDEIQPADAADGEGRCRCGEFPHTKLCPLCKYPDRR
jgi:hypothetical protein